MEVNKLKIFHTMYWVLGKRHICQYCEKTITRSPALKRLAQKAHNMILALCVFSVASLMSPKWKLINTKYFTLCKKRYSCEQCGKAFTQNFSFAAYKNSYLVNTTFVNIVRKQSQEAQILEGLIKKLTT